MKINYHYLICYKLKAVETEIAPFKKEAGCYYCNIDSDSNNLEHNFRVMLQVIF